MVMPVATPMAKLMPNSFPQNLRRVAPDFPAGHHVHAFHDGKQEREPERQRHEQKMIERRDCELQPAKG